ncbi:pheromone processing endoprotease [Mycoemilia scoparia]|uniref:Pheromone processing endoprotease n=1 Tax=Mycoemilia scoparia TaxID=417184 RepID=A0A9W8DKX8_9FUNG|nr:pheromone processing endoprotease [Mycoemilia scoparia]
MRVGILPSLIIAFAAGTCLSHSTDTNNVHVANPAIAKRLEQTASEQKSKASGSPASEPLSFDEKGYDYYNIKFDSTDESKAVTFAKSANMELVGPLGNLPQYFVFRTPSKGADGGLAKRSLENHHLSKRSQAILDLYGPEHGVLYVNPILKKRRLFKRDSIMPAPSVTGETTSNPFDYLGQRIANGTFNDPREWTPITDPQFKNQWHLHNIQYKGADVNVTGVWTQGITGYGVTVSLIDDGLDYTSEDLYESFFLEGSYDFNDKTKLPTPRLSDDYHGTRCAGQIAAARNNGVCGVGVAYNARVSGIRMLSARVSDADEAIALNYRYDKNDIYSCSWGPNDDGKTLEGPSQEILDAFHNGVTHGRDGKGSIFVFATGNGGKAGDNCNFDGYTNSIFTISIGAIDHLEQHPVYSEACSAQLAVTYSNGHNMGIVTTDIGTRQCTSQHGGTSAAAPLAAGIYALVLSVRPDLSWRDVQRLTVENSIPIQTDDSDWDSVAMGRMYNHKYGFGKMDAWRLVEAAKTFRNVAPQTSLKSEVITVDKEIPSVDNNEARAVGVESSHTFTEEDIKNASLKRLEHVTVTVNIDASYRGNIEVLLVSPSGKVSQLAAPRIFDGDKSGFRDWTFSTVKHWDETPHGEWKLRVRNNRSNFTGKLVDWKISLWGENTDIPLKPQPPVLYPGIPPRIQKDLNIMYGTNLTFPNGTQDKMPSFDMNNSQDDDSEGLRFTLFQTMLISILASAVSVAGSYLGYKLLCRLRGSGHSGWLSLGDKSKDATEIGSRQHMNDDSDIEESFELGEVIVAEPQGGYSRVDERDALNPHGEAELASNKPRSEASYVLYDAEDSDDESNN